MRNSSFCGYKPDIRFILAFLITLICSIICGIVLYKPVTSNEYFRNFVCEYVYNAFNFNNGPILLSHILADLIYLYALFFICFFTKLKYPTLVLIFIRGMFLGIYASLLIVVCSFSGILVLLIIFLPATLISLALCLFVMEGCKLFPKKYAIGIPAILAVSDCLVLVILVNVVFRIIIIIV